MAPRKRLTRTTPRRPRSENKPLTREQSERQLMMRNAGINGQIVADELRAQGITLTRQAVGNVIRNKFVNEDVIAVFCALVGSTRDEAWPDVPPLDEAIDDATKARLAKLRDVAKRRKTA